MAKVKHVPARFDPATSVAEMARELIRKYHSDLVNARIAYLYKNKSIVHGGRTAFATAEKCSPKVKALLSYNTDDDVEPFDFIITISYPLWNNLTDKQQLAILDHELQHCMVEETDEGDTVYKIVAHDLEDFTAIVRRHGIYMDNLRQMKDVLNKAKDI